MDKFRKILVVATLLLSTVLYGQDYVRIATWNIEHLGSEGRGFPEFMHMEFGMRSDDDLQKIAGLIDDTLGLDIVCVQEVAVSYKQYGRSRSEPLEKITYSLGNNWEYYLAYTGGLDKPEDEMQNAFLYNEDKVELLDVFEMNVPSYEVGEKGLFDRLPLVGHFVALDGYDKKNEFILVNVHLASGQDNDENHIAAMIIIDQNLRDELKKRDILEEGRTYRYALEERIILGDFNDNPYALKSNDECCKYMTYLYDYMERKGFDNLVTPEFITTRMNENYNSIIDHVLVHNTLRRHVKDEKAASYIPCPQDDTPCQLQWRATYSDHFPIYFSLEIYED